MLAIDNYWRHQMNDKLPFIWRKYYRNEATSSEKVSLETAHKQARQYLSRGIAVAQKLTRQSE
jgi:hypothetical protein